MRVFVDFANFDNFPTAMDTGNSGGEDWAKFDEVPTSSNKAEGDAAGWADFSNLEQMEAASSTAL